MEGLYSKMPSFSSYTEKNENIETRGEHGSGSVLRKVYFSSFDQSYVRFVNLETRSAFLHFLAVTKNSTDSYYNEIRFPVKCKGNSVFIHWSSHFSIFSFLFGSRRGRLWHRSSSSYKAQYCSRILSIAALHTEYRLGALSSVLLRRTLRWKVLKTERMSGEVSGSFTQHLSCVFCTGFRARVCCACGRHKIQWNSAFNSSCLVNRYPFRLLVVLVLMHSWAPRMDVLHFETASLFVTPSRECSGVQAPVQPPPVDILV